MAAESELERKLVQLCNRTDADFELNSWSRGDGRAHQLQIREGDKSITMISPVLSTNEMYRYISGYLDIEKNLWD